jgi:uncharacterized protein DUF3108
MLRRLTILTVACCLLAPAALAQGTRARRVEQRPAAAISAPRPEPGAPSLAVASVPFGPGETLSYDVEWNNNTTAATLVMRVGDRGTYFGQEGLELSADVETVGMVRFFASVQGTFKSYSNPKTLLPFRAEDRSSVNGKNQSRTIVFDRAKSVAVVDTRSTPIGADTGDPLALFYRLRATPLKVGDTLTLDGFVERREQWKVVVEARESVSAPRGRANAFRVAFMPIKGGQPDDHNKIRVWFTDDALRLPVLITAEPDFGPIRMTLSSATGTKG